MADRDAMRDADRGKLAEAFDDEDWAAEGEQSEAETRRLAAQLAALSGEDGAFKARPAGHLFPDFAGGSGSAGTAADFDMILDIPVQISVELGRARLPIGKLLQLAPGSVLELDSLAGEPLDLRVNGTLIAQGEVVVVNDKFGIRLTDIVTPAERMRKIRS